MGAEEHGLGDAYVRELPLRLAAVDEAQAKAAAHDFLSPDTLMVVIVGKADIIEPVLAQTGRHVRAHQLQRPDQLGCPRREGDQGQVVDRANARPRNASR